MNLTKGFGLLIVAVGAFLLLVWFIFVLWAAFTDETKFTITTWWMIALVLLGLLFLIIGIVIIGFGNTQERKTRAPAVVVATR